MNIKFLYYRFNESNLARQIKKRKKIIFFTCIIAFFIISPIIWYESMLTPKGMLNENESKFVVFEISNGTSASNLALNLQKQGLIKNPLAFKLYAKLNGLDTKIKSGKYQLSPSMSSKQILEKIVNGETVNEDIRVTIPEGSSLEKIALILDKKNLVEKEDFLNKLQADAYKDKYPFMNEFPTEATLEGFLFPDTYLFPPGKSAEFYIDIFLKRFQEVFFNEVEKLIKQNDLQFTTYQIVTLASIIEREAKLESEKPIISGVFHNRLKEGMPLQSCATVIFALNEYKEKLSFNDLEIDSPYNTYKYTGLPPGPICSPGLSSMIAAVDPSDVEYYYFLAKGDGSHIFSKTYSEHLKAQQQIEKTQDKYN